MFCTKCGHGNADDSAFCSSCGSPLTTNLSPTDAGQPADRKPVTPPQQVNIVPPGQAMPPQGQYGQGGYYPPQQPYQPQGAYAPYPQQKKKKTGLIVGLTVGGVVLIAAVLILLFVWPGFLNQSSSVTGIWYSEDRGEALEFKENGSIRVFTVLKDFRGDYTYDAGTRMGTITVEDDEYRFAVSEDGLYIEDMGNYIKADKDFDIDDFIDDMASENAGPEATQTEAPVVDNGVVDDPVIDEPVVEETKDVAVGADILGLWYESMGYAGTLEFYIDGTYKVALAGVEYTGTYQFDPATGRGTIIDPISEEVCNLMINEDGTLAVDSIYYTRDYVERLDTGDLGLTE